MTYVKKICIITTVVGVIKMGHIVPKEGFEPTLLATVLHITPPGLPDVTTLSKATSLCILAREVSADHCTHHGIVSLKWFTCLSRLNAYNYAQARFNNHCMY